MFIDALAIFDLDRNTMPTDRDYKVDLWLHASLRKPGEVQAGNGVEEIACDALC
jgi:hypothetical protein